MAVFNGARSNYFSRTAKKNREFPLWPLALGSWLDGHRPWALVWAGACYWNGVGGFVFNSSSKPSPLVGSHTNFTPAHSHLFGFSGQGGWTSRWGVAYYVIDQRDGAKSAVTSM